MTVARDLAFLAGIGSVIVFGGPASWIGLGVAFVALALVGFWRLRPLPAASERDGTLAAGDRPALPHPSGGRRWGARSR